MVGAELPAAPDLKEELNDMDHLSLRGAHWEMGFQWGARLAERGRFLLDHVPFPLTAERRAFAAACRPAYARHFPAALEGLAGLAAGQGCPREDLETVLCREHHLLSLIHI